ncbi:MAG: hypothetical protein AAGI11_12160 [Pseudomonadota bacterium]
MRALISIIIWLCFTASSHAQPTEYRVLDQMDVNGHAGYLSAWAVHGKLDKVLLIVPGFDTENDTLPMDELTGDFQPVINLLGASGWDIVYYEYVDGAIDLRDNADSLGRFIDVLEAEAEPDYHLAVLGGSMGGMVIRTLLVQENSARGIDSFVSLDAPHRGVTLSSWVNEDLLSLALDYPAARQMTAGRPEYRELYGWLESREARRGFRRKVLEPIATCAVTLSDGSGRWRINAAEETLHNRYYAVSSYVEYSGLRSSYMPYHSTALLMSEATKKKVKRGRNVYRYKRARSRYFDLIIPNARDEHGAPVYAVEQALQFITTQAPQP